MEWVTLNSGNRMPLLGLGTADPEPNAMKVVVEKALSFGYRLFDCATLYNTERQIGDTLRRAISAGMVQRDDIFITSKLPMNGMRREKVLYFFEKSLHDLQLDYLDLYLIHAPFAVKYVADNEYYPVDPISKCLLEDDVCLFETWKALEDLYEKGLTKAIGISNFNLRQIKELLKVARIKPAVLQIEMHPYLQQNELVGFCKQNGIHVEAFAPLGSPSRAKDLKKSPVLENEVLGSIGSRYGKTIAQTVLRWMTQKQITAIPKAANEQELKENIDIFDFEISAEDMSMIFKLDKGERLYYFDETTGTKEHPQYPF